MLVTLPWVILATIALQWGGIAVAKHTTTRPWDINGEASGQPALLLYGQYRFGFGTDRCSKN